MEFALHDDDRDVDHDTECLAAWERTPTAAGHGPLAHCRHGTWIAPWKALERFEEAGRHATD